MPVSFTYPGVYVEEIPSGVHTIVGVSTSTTAFVDYFKKGPMNQAVRISSFDDFQRVFGGLDPGSEASYGIMQYYLNGGQIAYVIRVASGTTSTAQLVLHGSSPPQSTLIVHAANEGSWANGAVQIATNYVTANGVTNAQRFNLVVRDVETVGGRTVVKASEIYRNLTMVQGDPQFAIDVVNNASTLIHLEESGLGSPPLPTAAAVTDDITAPSFIGTISNGAFKALGDPTNPDAAPGVDGGPPDVTALQDGMHALDRIDPFIFNLLCLPAAANLPSAQMGQVYSDAAAYCDEKRAFLIVDVPPSFSSFDAITNSSNLAQIDGLRDRNAAVYFPRLLVFDTLNPNKLRNIGPSGTMAGIYGRTDATRGVWKAPAGTDATLRGVQLATVLNDQDNGALNPLGINVLRNFPIFANVSWGARTLDGADQMASEWKYIPVRRTALYIEESLRQGLKWVVFEPNDEPLWAQIRLNVGAFMHDLFRQGAFQGQTPQQAYLVRCDRNTTTQNDIDQGIVNILVGFAPLKPAEFVVIQLQQIAGQIEV
jgi:uncharacterized protein